MKTFSMLTAALTLAVLAFAAPAARAADGKIASKIAVVAAENFYGGVAREIGGDRVEVISILNSPDQDPHLFETSPGVVRQIADARIVIYNGADYDPWMEKLLAAAPRPGRTVIIAAELTPKKPGDNPHLWYDPPTMPAVAKAMAAALRPRPIPRMPADYAARLATHARFAQAAREKIGAVREQIGRRRGHRHRAGVRLDGDALGLTMRNESFQLAVMNDTEPSASDIAGFEDDLKEHKVRVCSTTSRCRARSSQHLIAMARAAKVPVVGVTETRRRA